MDEIDHANPKTRTLSHLHASGSLSGKDPSQAPPLRRQKLDERIDNLGLIELKGAMAEEQVAMNDVELSEYKKSRAELLSTINNSETNSESNKDKDQTTESSEKMASSNKKKKFFNKKNKNSK